MAIPVLGDIISSVLGKVGDVASELITDKDKKAQLKFEIARLEVEMADRVEQRLHEQLIAQTEVNKVEAAHRSIFVAGWRPAVGWGCGAALVYNTMIAPALGLGVADLGFLQTILLGMLGIAGMRSFDKKVGTANDVLPIVKPKAVVNTGNPTSYSSEGIPDYTVTPEKTPWE